MHFFSIFSLIFFHPLEMGFSIDEITDGGGGGEGVEGVVFLEEERSCVPTSGGISTLDGRRIPTQHKKKR
jgi:hypothetical protein